ncbi:MAG: flagellar biosynthesis anti-sigma factor FlgM [Firmicutes bacterium]|nr:flagellar biosynthesis anti-sigma factor FlgM [Bacillota bacterium]
MNPIDPSTSKTVVNPAFAPVPKTPTSKTTVAPTKEDNSRKASEDAPQKTDTKKATAAADEKKAMQKDLQKLQQQIADGAYTVDLGRLASALIKKQALS